MNKYLSICIFLTLTDQFIKIFIYNSFELHYQFNIFSDYLAFHPDQNIQMGFIQSAFNFKIPLYVIILLDILGFPLVVILYRYLRFVSSLLIFEKYKELLVMFWTFFISGSLCKIIDDVFWGGSLDYFLLFNWLIFDLKDICINSALILIVIYIIVYFKCYLKLSKLERKNHSKENDFLKWLKLGLPLRKR